MANNKVQLANGTVLIDLTDTTATASDVASGSYFYDAAGVKQSGTLVVDETYSVSKTLTNVTSSNDDTKVIAGNSFYADLTPTSGYAITSIAVTMGGVDVTEQVFKPGTGAKAIVANGTYNASADSLSGYDRVVVNVPPTQPDLGTKTITANGTYTASDDSLDGYSEVTVNVPTGSTPTGTKQISITENGTTAEDVAAYANVEITVNVQGGGVDTLGALLDNTLTSFSYAGNVALTPDLFKSKTSLRSVSLPDVTTLPTNCFSGCSNIESFDFSSVVTIAASGMQAFGAHSSLNAIHLPNLETITGGYAFADLGSASHLMTLVLPKLKSMSSDLLRGGFLNAVDFGPDVTQLNNRTFYGTSRYNNVILRRTSGVVTCTNANALSGLNANTTVWVPASLLSQYQSETNWSAKSTINWATIEGSSYENAYADGTPIA